MTTKNLTNYLKKKKLLDNVNLSAEDCRKYGNIFLEAGWLSDALDFFSKGKISEGLEKLETIAIDSGDAFLLERLLQIQGREAPELWEKVAINATVQEKFTMAEWARERAGKVAGVTDADSAGKAKSSGLKGDDRADHA